MHLYLGFSLFAVLITCVINYTEIRLYVRQAVLSIKTTEALDFSRVRVHNVDRDLLGSKVWLQWPLVYNSEVSVSSSHHGEL